jgi:hypothetical protein
LNIDQICLFGTIVQITNKNQRTFFEQKAFKTPGIYAWEITISRQEMERICKRWNSRNKTQRIGFKWYLLLQFEKALKLNRHLDEFKLFYIGKTERTVEKRLQEEYNQTYNDKPSDQLTLNYFLKKLSKDREFPTRVCLVSRDGTLRMEETVGKLLNIIPGCVSKDNANAINREKLG